jgi:hypothetical protein
MVASANRRRLLLCDTAARLVPATARLRQRFHYTNSCIHRGACSLRTAIRFAILQLPLAVKALVLQPVQPRQQRRAALSCHVVLQFGVQIQKVCIVHAH